MPTANGVRCRTRVGAGHPRWMPVGCPTVPVIGVMSLTGDGPGFPTSLGAGRPTTPGFGSLSEAAGAGGPTMIMMVGAAEMDMVVGTDITDTPQAIGGVQVVITSCPGAAE